MHERQVIQEAEEKRQRELEAKTFNSQIIQAFYRAYMFRKYARTNGKPPKKGKGAKGKKGKK